MEWQSLPHTLTVEALYTAFERQCERNFYFGGEMHDFWEMVYVAEGLAGASADDVIYRLQPGQLLFHKPMEFHRLWAESGSCPRLFILSFKLSGTSAKMLENKVFQLDCESEEMLLKLIALIRTYYRPVTGGGIEKREQTTPAACQIIANHMERLFLFLLEKPALHNNRNHSQSAKNYSILINTIEEHLPDIHSLEQLASMCNMSASNVKKIFSKYAGQGVKQYINRRKASRAAELLLKGYSVTQTSDFLGFSSQSYFSTVFKQIMGQRPSEYK